MSSADRPRIRLGIEAENQGKPATDPGIIEMAVAAENQGVDSVSVSDHLLSFDAHASDWLEAMTSLAAISSVTNRVQLVTSVVILPQRNTLEFIRIAHSIDALSKGRLVLGVGSGWNGREMEALGYDFPDRGQRMDEMLAVMRGVKNGNVPPFEGKHVHMPQGITITPHPGPDRRIPLYVGGSGASKVSARRALRFADGWMTHGVVDHIDSDALTKVLTYLRSERERSSLPPLDTIFKLGVSGSDDPGMERAVVEVASLGFDEVIVQGVWDRGIDAGVDAIQRLRRALDTQ